MLLAMLFCVFLISLYLFGCMAVWVALSTNSAPKVANGFVLAACVTFLAFYFS